MNKRGQVVRCECTAVQAEALLCYPNSLRSQRNATSAVDPTLPKREGIAMGKKKKKQKGEGKKGCHVVGGSVGML